MAQIINRVEGMLDAPPRPQAKVINRDAVLALPDMRAYAVNGQFYITPPVSFRMGIRVEKVVHTLGLLKDRKDDAARVEYAAVMYEALTIIRSLFKPIGKGSWLNRQLWRLRLYDPTRGWTEGQIGQVLGFLFASRMNRRVWSGQMENLPQ